MLKLFFIATCLLLFAWIKEAKGCTGGVLRLEGSEGRLEACVEDQWISVCGNGWTESAGNVACRQLGYESVSSHQTTPTTSVNGILFHWLNCSGSEASLFQCSNHLSLTSNCNMTLLQCNQTVSDVECSTGDVRLLHEEGVPNAGTVSLCVSNHWANITDESWSDNDAMVVCKMLNFQSGSVGSDYEPGSGGSSDDSVKCDGSELSIYQCIVSLEAAVNNDLAQEASVLCQIGGGFENGAVRLYRNGVHSSQYYFGIVQLQYNGVTGNICDDLNYGHNEADVMCHQLGYEGASSHSRAGLMSYGLDNSPTLLDDVHCPSPDYLTILQCSYSTDIDSGCSSNSNDVIVHCYMIRIWDTSPFQGMIRLQSGSYSNEGRIEVYCNGQWGSICSAGFSSSAANTVCRQLGYSGHNGYNHLKLVSSPDVVWFNGITSEGVSNCITSIASCPSQPVTNCNEGATVECIIREFDKVTNQINSCNDTTLVTITPSQTTTSSLVTTEHTSTTTSTTNTILPTVGGTELPFYRESIFLYTGAGVTVFIIFLLCIICCCCCCHCYCRRKKSIPYNARHSQHITQQIPTITSGTSDDLCIVHNPMAEDMVDNNTDPSIAPSSPSVAPPPAPPLASVPPPPPPPPPPPAVGSSHTMPNRRSASLPNHESMLNETLIASPPPSAPPPPPLPSTPPSAPPPPSAMRTFPRKVSAPPSLSPIPAFRHPAATSTRPPSNTSTDQYFNSLPSRKSNPTTPQHVTSGPAPPPAPPPPPIPSTNSMDRRLSQPARPIGSIQQQQQQFQSPARLQHYSSTQPDPTIPSAPQAVRGPPPNSYSAAAANLSQYFERRVSFNN